MPDPSWLNSKQLIRFEDGTCRQAAIRKGSSDDMASSKTYPKVRFEAFD